MIRISENERLQLIDDLEKRGLFFRSFWSVSDIYLTENIKTACVRYTDTRVHFEFNPVFWESGGLKFKLFLICHEQLHIMMNHYARLQFANGDVENKNIAADLAVNHYLIRNYDFNRDHDIPNWKKYCWVDTVFPSRFIPDNETCEYYYAQINSGTLSPDTDIFDDHSTVFGDDAGVVPKWLKDIISESIDEMIDEATKDMDENEKQEWLDDHDEWSQSLATTGHGTNTQTHEIKKTKSECWQALYRKIPKRIFNDNIQQHWINPGRRYATLNTELILPGDHEGDKPDKVCVNVYLDTSGSCMSHARHFLEAALSMDSAKFAIKMYGFGTKVYELSKKPPYNLHGFGNESYQAVSDHVDTFKNIDVVFVLTDGFSRRVNPKEPEKWHWFLTPNGTTNYIHPNCNTYDLTKYGWKG